MCFDDDGVSSICVSFINYAIIKFYFYYSIFISCTKCNVNVIIYEYVQNDPYLKLLKYLFQFVIKNTFSF